MNKKAFTLVELIVVITILAVLATVAFISFQGHAITARDSARISDLKSMTKIIELYNIRNGKYPYPDSKTNVTYSGAIAWSQGVFGTSSYTNGSSMSNVPVDPVTGLEYPYSITSSRQEYQIAAVLENVTTSKLTSTTYAGTQEAQVYVKGNYNGKFLKVRKNSTTFLLGVPSILASDITSVDLEIILANEKLVYNGYKNLPASYSGSVYNTNPNNGFPFGTGTYVANKVVLFEGDIKELESDISKRTIFLTKLQDSYSGTTLKSETDIAELIAIDSSSSSVSSNYVATALNNSLKMNIPTIEVVSTPAVTNWTTLLSGPSRDIFNNVAIDSLGNSYISGYFSGSPTIDGVNITSNGGYDIFVAKINKNGNAIWAKSSGGVNNDKTYSIDVDGSGNVYITGLFNGNINLFGENIISAGGNDIFVLKLDSNGNKVWIQTAGGVGSDISTSIAVDNSGNVYISGTFAGANANIFGDTLTAVGGGDIFITKFDTNGVKNWQSIISGLTSGSTSENGIGIDGSGNVFIAGNYKGTASFVGTSSTSANSGAGQDIFALGLNNDGTYKWLNTANNIAGTSGGDARGLAVDLNGDIYITGQFLNKEINLFGDSISVPGSWEVAYVTKLDGTNGSSIWSDHTTAGNGEYGEGIGVDSTGNVYMCGSFNGTNRNIFGSIYTSTNSDIFYAKFDTNGNRLYARQIEGTGWDWSSSIVADSLGNVRLIGYYPGDVTIGSFVGTSLGGEDSFIYYDN